MFPWFGLLDLTVWQTVAVTLLMTHITIVSVTVYLHRYSAHRALNLHPAVQHFFRFWLWLTTSMITREWTAIHRKHHAKCETPDDPHSPQVKGLRKVLLEGAELYRAEAGNRETIERYGQNCPTDWIERHLYTPHANWGPTLLAVINLVLFGLPGITVWAVQMLWIPIFAAGVINGLGHFWGYRNFECADASRNLSPWGILIGGEELHNNHHTYPNSAKLSTQWFEFDIGWFYIQVLSLLGLAKVNKVPPKPYRVRGKRELDADTAMAVVMNRFQVMAQYSKRVIAPLVAQEAERAAEEKKPLFHRARALLSRETSLLDSGMKERLQTILSNSQALDRVYSARLKLQEVWSRTHQSKQDMQRALGDWCKEAEASGIKALEDFSELIRSYALNPQMAAVKH